MSNIIIYESASGQPNMEVRIEGRRSGYHKRNLSSCFSPVEAVYLNTIKNMQKRGGPKTKTKPSEEGKSIAET